MWILLLRHAESTWNEQQRWQGWADPPLSDSGRRAASRWTAPVAFDEIVSSDLARASETAHLIASTLGRRPTGTCFGLREQNQGAWTGLTKLEIKRRWPDRFRNRPRQPVDGETSEQVAGRVLDCLSRLARGHAGRRVLLVTHAGVIRTVEAALTCMPLPIPHLEGRWIELAASAHSRSFASWRPGEATAGRCV